VISLLADENFDRRIVRGILDRLPNTDVVYVQELGLSGIDDDDLLDRAAAMGRVLLTHDVQTLFGYAVDRITAGLSMPGVIEVRKATPIGVAVEELVIVTACGLPTDFQDQVLFLPLRSLR
jgi:hypothetical protein